MPRLYSFDCFLRSPAEVQDSLLPPLLSVIPEAISPRTVPEARQAAKSQLGGTLEPNELRVEAEWEEQMLGFLGYSRKTFAAPRAHVHPRVHTHTHTLHLMCLHTQRDCRIRLILIRPVLA